MPTYVHIDSVGFYLTPSSKFAVNNNTKSHSVTSVIVYYNNTTVGEFDLPCTVPIRTDAQSGTGKLEIAPCINVNGLNNSVVSYPFYQLDTSSFTIQPGKIFTRLAKTTYYNAATITKLADFEGNLGFKLAGGNVEMRKVTTPASSVFEGYGSGSIALMAVGDSSVDTLSPIQALRIPFNTAAFIEFDYKSDVPFYVGLASNLEGGISSSPYYLAGIAPISHWQKFYLQVSDFVGSYTGDTYTLYIKTSLGSGQTSGTLLLDNVQLITY